LGKRKQDREVKPSDLENQQLHFKRDFSRNSVKIGFNLPCFTQEMLITGLLKFKTMNFKESLMSVTPKNLPKRVRVLVKDLLFQEKHQLTDTQVDIMSYIFNAFVWAMKVEGYIILTSKKITDDMPQIGQKTLEASLKELENKGLIEKNVVIVPPWNNSRARGIKITSNGMEYNSSLYAPSHQAIINAYQERIDELEKNQKERKDEPTTEKKICKSSDQKEQNGGRNSGQEKEIGSRTQSTQKNATGKAIGRCSLEFAQNSSEVTASASQNSEPRTQIPNFEDFIKKTRNRFLLTSEPICNRAEGWQKETTFYINSYGKLSLTTPSMNFLQVENAIDINKFWRWLFNNQHRVGEVIPLEKISENLLELNKKYRDKQIKINGKTRWIEELIPMTGGVAIKVKNEHRNVTILVNASKEPIAYAFDILERFISTLEE
jgi:DNA-binding HxlR family transcriptional regulator